MPIALDHLTLLSLEVLRRFLVAKLDGSLDFKTRQRDGTQLRHFFLGRVQPGSERKRVVVGVRGYLLLVGLRARLQIAWWRRNIRIRLEKDRPHNTVQYNTIHTIQFNVIQYNAIQYNIIYNIIIYMKKFLDPDWLITVQSFLNKVQNKPNNVQKYLTKYKLQKKKIPNISLLEFQNFTV